MGDRWAWTGYVAAGCAVLRLPLHLYYGLGGSAGLSVVDRSAPSTSVDPGQVMGDPGQVAVGSASLRPLLDALPGWLPPETAEFVWRGAHLATAVVLAGVAVLAVALVRPWGRRLPSPVLVAPAFVVVVTALGYAGGAVVSRVGPLLSGALPVRLLTGDAGVPGSDWLARWGRWVVGDGLGQVLAFVGPGAPERSMLRYTTLVGELPAYPLSGVTAFGPWALALGLLLAVAVTHRLGGSTARRIWLVAIVLAVLRLSC